jgi:RNA polymerase sigma-70 factor, ECF subfamily
MKPNIRPNYGDVASCYEGDGRLEPAPPTNGESDSHLVEKTKKGDTSAFEKLIAQHSRKVYFSVLRITQNRADTEDVMQEALLNAYTHISTFEGRARFHTWFTTIAINQALMCLRKRKKHCASIPIAAGDDEELSLPDIPDMRPSVDVEIEKRERASMIGRETKRLPPQLRSVFCMRALGEMSNREVAKTLGISVVAVKARMLRARRHLKRRVLEHSPQHRLNTRDRRHSFSLQ